MDQHLRRLRGPVGGLVATALLLLAAAGCTGSDDRKATQSPLPRRSVGSAATLQARPVPMDVRVAKVVGSRLKRPQEAEIEQQVSRVLSRYFDAAFLAGEYPRKDFSKALEGFSRGAAQRAASDRDLLTNAGIGPTTESVAPRVKLARLDLLVPGRFVAGLTARVRLVFLQKRTDGADQRVTVAGRLMMSRTKTGPWQIFGYDLTRSSEPVGKGETR